MRPENRLTSGTPMLPSGIKLPQRDKALPTTWPAREI